jgi:hypothetical protein
MTRALQLSWRRRDEHRLRQQAVEDARALALGLCRGRLAGVAAYRLGVVLDAGEVAWTEVSARFYYGPTSCALWARGGPPAARSQ